METWIFYRPLVQSLICILMIFEGYCRSSLWITRWERKRCRTQANLLKKIPTCLIQGLCPTRSNRGVLYMELWGREEDSERPSKWTSQRDCDGMKWADMYCCRYRAMRDLHMERRWRESQTHQFKGVYGTSDHITQGFNWAEAKQSSCGTPHASHWSHASLLYRGSWRYEWVSSTPLVF